MVAVFFLYEFVYSFYQRWRVSRSRFTLPNTAISSLMFLIPSECPPILPIYFSSAAFNLASMTSYDTFSFLRHIRSIAWDPDRGGCVRDGIAETCWYLSQNTANIALLLPRAGLCLALLLTFSSSQPGTMAFADPGSTRRNRTFFNPQDGMLSGYAEGVLIANVAWAVWRALVWVCAWYARYLCRSSGSTVC